MKKSFFKKLMITLAAFSGVFVMSSCQRADHSATIPVEHCEVTVFKDESTGKKVATVTLAVNNPTIYNTKEITFKYEARDEYGVVIGSDTVVLPIGIRHGVAGSFTYAYTAKDGEADQVRTVKITEAKISGYQTLWETYMASFLIAIILASLSIIFFGFELFRRGLSKQDLKDLFAQHMVSEFAILGLVLLICLIPLIFSSWVTTVILLGGFAASMLATGIMSLIRIRLAD